MSARERIKAGFEAVGMSGARADKMYSDLVSALKEEIPEWTFSAEIRQPDLIQGYTAEQWAEIIDGGYLCEARDLESREWVPVTLLEIDKGDTGYPFLVRYSAPDDIINNEVNDDWKFCRPAQIKGVMRPIFVSPENKDEARCHFFSKDDIYLGTGFATELYDGRATKYIEV